MTGIGGVAMGSLAGMFAKRGYRVSGSDENLYPPMSDRLREWGIPVFEGYAAANVGDPDLVVIGNAVGRGNPEVEHVLNARL
ncbi:MAG TPA: UDP-N-acetylmuramate--alanine ligase, partial [Spirochaetes bacterium]|nr:UDP-N-acetylmuramate--alanine ligase [Spirochaetota bacterium]